MEKFEKVKLKWNPKDDKNKLPLGTKNDNVFYVGKVVTLESSTSEVEVNF